MALNVPASQKFLKSLKCAYTGKTVEVRAISSGDRPPLYFSPDAFDPTDLHKSSESLFAALGTRDGVQGAARDGAEFVCPYTGAKMSVKPIPGFGHQAVGGFSPSTPVADPVAFARAMLMRGGVVPKSAPKPTPPPVVKANVELEPPPAIQRSPDDSVMAAAEGVLRKVSPRKITVPSSDLSGLKR